MGISIYKLNNDKAIEIQKSTELQAQVNSLNGAISNLQRKIDNVSKTINSNNSTKNENETNTSNNNTIPDNENNLTNNTNQSVKPNYRFKKYIIPKSKNIIKINYPKNKKLYKIK